MGLRGLALLCDCSVLKLALCGTPNSPLLWMVTLRGWWDLVHVSKHSSPKVRPVQATEGERWSEGTSTALGISGSSGLAEKVDEAVGRVEGAKAEVVGSEPAETASLLISSSEAWLQKGLTQRKGDPKLQQA